MRNTAQPVPGRKLALLRLICNGETLLVMLSETASPVRQSDGLVPWRARTEASLAIRRTSALAAWTALMVGICSVIAQDSPPPEATASATIAATPTPSPSPARSARISFVPPPIEATISLGIYDSAGKLVRTLHREAELDVFTVGPDALITAWDGKSDAGEDLPGGRYHARGFAVAKQVAGEFVVTFFKNPETGETISHDNFTVENGEPIADGTGKPVPEKAGVKLQANPLEGDVRKSVELMVGFDEQGSFLKAADGLPLCTVSDTAGLKRALITKSGEKSVDVWQSDGTLLEQIRVSHVNKMMAFDCGDFELK